MTEIYCKKCEKSFYSKQTKQRHDAKLHPKLSSNLSEQSNSDEESRFKIGRGLSNEELKENSGSTSNDDDGSNDETNSDENDGSNSDETESMSTRSSPVPDDDDNDTQSFKGKVIQIVEEAVDQKARIDNDAWTKVQKMCLEQSRDEESD